MGFFLERRDAFPDQDGIRLTTMPVMACVLGVELASGVGRSRQY